MLRPGVTQEWVDEGELPRERTKNRRWRRPYDVLAEATRGEVVVRRRVFMCASELALDESLSHQVVYHRGRSPSASTSESHGGGRDHVNDQELLGALLRGTMQRQKGLWIQGVNATVLQRRVFRVCASKLASDESLDRQHMGAMYHRGSMVKRGEGATTSPVGLSYRKVKASIRKAVDSEEHHSAAKANLPIAKEGMQMQIMDSKAIGLAAPWYLRGRTFVESSIPCSHRGRALVVKGAEEVENAKANSKYQDRAKGQRPRNFIKPMSMGFSSR
ncbi:hypothetical protein B296_00047975 [Ensete ventricosum]|uniref:Uncharacterized protein n=1 Tax=Ensete ventricosum TaxID=4639 RepID=A0A426XPH4_ENSVE|nr:hypothetical protein B296_00047975 [Ensete ventricosum]